MSKQMIYVRLEEGFSVSRSVESFSDLLFEDEQCHVVLKDGKKGFISRRMAKKILREKPELLRRSSTNPLIEWLLSETGIEPDERDWLERLADAFKN
jgi:hypothetical protein